MEHNMKMNNKPTKKNFYVRILLPTILTIILFVTVLFVLIIPHFENTIMDRKREMIKELTNSVWSIMDKWYRAEKEGNITKEKAQEMAISQIQSLRYGEGSKDYFWITDYSPNMIMHPYRFELNKKDLSDFVDSNGKKLFVEMAEKAKKNGDGFVDYMWQWKDDSTKIVPKLSYVKAFIPWQWVVGTGIYVEDVTNEIAQLEKKIINISVGITLAISILLFFIAWQNLRAEKLRLKAESELQESREKYRALAEASTEGLIMVLTDGQIFFNKTLYNILGYKEDPLMLTLSELFITPPKLKSIDISTLKITPLQNYDLDQVETIIKKVDGTLINVLLNVSPISFLDNSGVVLSVKDISINKKIEAELDQSKENYLTLTNKLSIGVFSAHAAKGCKFIESNSALLKLLEVERKEVLLETSIADYFEDVREFDSFHSDLMNFKSIQNRMIIIRKSTGSKLPVSVSAFLVTDEYRGDINIDGVIEDISVQNKSNRERDSLINELQTAFLFLNNSIDKFVRPIPLCNHNTPVINAIGSLTAEKSDCLLIIDQSDNPIGFLSESDIRTRILMAEDNMKKPVFEFMSSPLITISNNSTIFDALIKLNEYKKEHLLYKTANGKIEGVLNSSDLQKAFHSAYLFFVQKIQMASTISELSIYNSQLILLLRGLIEKQTTFIDITKMLSTISDSIYKRVVSLAIEKLGAPPVKFAFIVLGSAGRGEQTLATDQDNAIIFEKVDASDEELTKKYFLKMGEFISDNLNQIGYNLCKGEIMAKNPKWCQPVSIWKNYFTDWVTTANPKDLLDIKIFFDFRIIYGAGYLVDELRDHIISLTTGYNSFFVYLSESIVQFQLPENALKIKLPFDLKMVLLPIVDSIRLYALKNKCTSTNTIDRLKDAYENGIFTKQSYKNILHVYSFLMQKRFEHQSNYLVNNIPANNQINPSEFSDVDIVLFKKSLAVIEEIQNKLKLDFRGTLSV